MLRLVIATHNIGKLNEFRSLIGDIPLDMMTLDEAGFKTNIEETGSTFEENATLKAKTIGKKIKLLTLAEDSGLEIDALGGKPGIFSARYVAGSDNDRIDKVLKDMEGIPDELRTARYKAVVAIYNPQQKTIYTFQGIAEGKIIDQKRGRNGFGYDPIFLSRDLRKTFAEATEEEKNSVSHRARAIEKARPYLLSLV